MKILARFLIILFVLSLMISIERVLPACAVLSESELTGLNGRAADIIEIYTELPGPWDFSLSTGLAILDSEGGKSDEICLRNPSGHCSVAVEGKDRLWLYVLDEGGILGSSFDAMGDWSFQVVAAKNPSNLDRIGSIILEADSLGLRHRAALSVRQKGSMEAGNFCAATAPYQHEKKTLPGCPICDLMFDCNKASAIAASYIAEAAYGSTPTSSDPAEFSRRTGIPDPNESKDPNAYFGAVQTDAGYLVIASFSGTQYKSGTGKYIKDWSHNLNALSKEGIHAGYMNYFNDFLNNNLNRTLTSIQFQTWSRDMSFEDMVRAAGTGEGNVHFLITGHSLGGALAQIMTYWLIEQGVERKGIVTYTYGSPGPFTEAFIKSNDLDIDDSCLNVYNFSNPDDILTKAGVWLFAGANINGSYEFFDIPEVDENPHTLGTYRNGIEQDHWIHVPD